MRRVELNMKEQKIYEVIKKLSECYDPCFVESLFHSYT